MLSSKKAGIKRKTNSRATELANKKSKHENLALDNLPWKTISRPTEAEGDDGILLLEEVEGVGVVYEDMPTGRIAKFYVSAETEKGSKDKAESKNTKAGSDDDKDEHVDSGDEAKNAEEDPVDEPFDTVNILPHWSPHPLHPLLLASLHRQNFTTPTPIQARALPAAIQGKDVVGVAETGSGKTLAYGLPILHYLLQPNNKRNHKMKRQPQALILAPTRELALQVASHLTACVTSAPEVKEQSVKPLPRVSVAAIVGGMSAQKQRRVLDRGVDVLVATPGRLWDLLGEDDDLSQQLKQLKFLVLDEADRMIETGHFAELDNIVRLTLRQSLEDETLQTIPFLPGQTTENIVESEQKGVGVSRDDMQTFVFSATLSKELQRNLKKSKGKGGRTKKPASTLDELLLKLDFRDSSPEVIDLSPEGGAVSSLKESQVECLSADKDVYLYYFLLRYPGRSLIFLSSIDGIRRLLPLTELLQLNAFPLHSQLQQKQRLKNLDRFKKTSNSILLATDIAARGLDIPSVDHVIHYQIPRSADVYIHRNGRTARASRKGFSLLMCAPDEKRIVRGLLGSLSRGSAKDIPDMPIELNLLDKLKTRVQLARKIETAQHKIKKDNHDRNWMKETAEAMELELDSDFADVSDDTAPQKHRNKTRDSKAVSLKVELKRLLSQPLIAQGISQRYITSGARGIVDELIDGGSHRTMLGFKQTDAGSDLVHSRKVGKKIKEKTAVVEEEEEWTGIES